MRQVRTLSAVAAILSVGFVDVSSFHPARSAPASAAQVAAPLKTQETNATGIVAEFMECRRSEGVLTVRVRLRNTGAAKVDVDVISARNYDAFYVTADAKKYLVLRDSEGTPLAVAANSFGGVTASIAKGGTWTWWAKYPAPPAAVTKITYMSPIMAPFEDVPISNQ